MRVSAADYGDRLVAVAQRQVHDAGRVAPARALVGVEPGRKARAAARACERRLSAQLGHHVDGAPIALRVLCVHGLPIDAWLTNGLGEADLEASVAGIVQEVFKHLGERLDLHVTSDSVSGLAITLQRGSRAQAYQGSCLRWLDLSAPDCSRQGRMLRAE